MANKVGRPKNAIPNVKISVTAPANFRNTLQIAKYKTLELDWLSDSEKIVKIVEMFANGDLIHSPQYYDKQKI